jgi:hypothetical protein
MRETKVESTCFGSKRSPVRVWAPRPAGQLVGGFEFTGSTCFGVGRAPPGTRGAEASAAPDHHFRSKFSIAGEGFVTGTMRASRDAEGERGLARMGVERPSL